MTTIKPDIDVRAAEAVLERHFGRKVHNIAALSGGNVSRVYSFRHEGGGYVIHFSDLKDAFQTSAFVSELLTGQGVRFPRHFGTGKTEGLTYSISEKIEGCVFAELPDDRKQLLLQDLVEAVSRMNQVDLGRSRGFGWITPDGNGSYPSWEAFLIDFYKEEQTGTFWEGWHRLFTETFLDRDVFEECYARLMAFAKYNAPHRHFVHNDCHAWNILSDRGSVTGIIDSNGIYGDFLIDVACLDGAVPGRDITQAFRDLYERQGVPLDHVEERMLGARYYKGLDAMRFYAKMGWRQAYDELRDRLLTMTK